MQKYGSSGLQNCTSIPEPTDRNANAQEGINGTNLWSSTSGSTGVQHPCPNGEGKTSAWDGVGICVFTAVRSEILPNRWMGPSSDMRAPFGCDDSVEEVFNLAEYHASIWLLTSSFKFNDRGRVMYESGIVDSVATINNHAAVLSQVTNDRDFD
ncbi:hypothetical protein ARMSODRAFT_982608 [Armillaria solidipes]|uniref:Uncharacterized protein n=1 Tax=Armillaria solidipes TaxID=1076256 RepID=A0A2H3B217_9AGAR|nr:hypothetical protein ARMSODRAFT_982608 [Armillaria solidipes]